MYINLLPKCDPILVSGDCNLAAINRLGMDRFHRLRWRPARSLHRGRLVPVPGQCPGEDMGALAVKLGDFHW